MCIFSKVVEEEGGEIPDYVSQNVRSNRRSYVKENQVGNIIKENKTTDKVMKNDVSVGICCFFCIL